jgi:hypothetical protein
MIRCRPCSSASRSSGHRRLPIETEDRQVALTSTVHTSRSGSRRSGSP